MSGIRCVLVALMVLMVARGAYAQPADVHQALLRARAIYPTPMQPAQNAEMLSRALADFPGWELLRKDGGNNCPTPYAGIGISCDWVIHVQSGWGYDVVSDQEGAGSIVQSSGVPNGAGIATVKPWPVGTVPHQPQQPQNPQQPQTPAAIDYDRIRVLVGLEVAPILTYLANMKDNDAAIRGDIAAVSEQVKVHDEKTNVIIGWLKNAKTYLIAGSGLAGWLLPKVLASQPQPQGAN